MSDKRFRKLQGFMADNNRKMRGDVYAMDFTEVEDMLNALHEENEQLRKTINEVIELLLKEVDLFSDKATEHDIIAYKEMNQFDNKDAYYMCISTKKAIQMLKRCLNE